MPRLPHPAVGRPITIELDGAPVPAVEGEPVACALIAADETLLSRSVKYHRPRGAFCMTGACSHCLMRVDGVPNLQACQVPARAGMRLERQNAFPSAKVDVFATIDWFFPRGLDHHSMFAGVPVAETVMARVARQLAGLGKLPDRDGPLPPPAEELRVPVAVVGGGAAGLAAAQILQEAGTDFLLVERDDVLGGRLVAGPQEELPLPQPPPAERVWTGSSALALLDDHQGPYLAVVRRTPPGPRLVKLRAERLLLANGAQPRMIPFGDNELPGIYAGRAVTAMIRRWHVSPGEAVALVGHGPELEGVHAALLAAQIPLAVVLDLGPPGASTPSSTVSAALEAIPGRPVEAHGHARVSGLTYVTPEGRKVKVRCDAIAIAVPPGPSYELAAHAGVPVDFHPGEGTFVVRADAEGRTTAPFLYVAGELTGSMRAREAAESGRRAARALLEDAS